MAWHDLRQRYKRSWIGIGWIGVSFAIFMSVKIFVFGAMVDTSIAYYAAHVTVGYLLYRLIANAVIGGTGVFVSSQNWIKSEPLPIMVHVYKLMTNNFMLFAIMAVPALGICAYFRVYHLQALFSLTPTLLIYAINTVSIATIVGIISARYRDVMHFSSTVMQVAYFLSPVLWIPPETGPRAIAAQINPITHFVALLRTPMLDGTIPWSSWLIVLGITVFSAAASLLLFITSRRKLIFWL